MVDRVQIEATYKRNSSIIEAEGGKVYGDGVINKLSG